MLVFECFGDIGVSLQHFFLFLLASGSIARLHNFQVLAQCMHLISVTLNHELLRRHDLLRLDMAMLLSLVSLHLLTFQLNLVSLSILLLFS